VPSSSSPPAPAFFSSDQAQSRNLLTQLRLLFRYREAIGTLVARDLKVRYSNSALGVLWSLFTPLLMMIVFTVVFTFFMPSAIERYPVYILAGLLPWNFLTSSLAASVTSIIHNGPLISRVYFPRDILPVSVVLSNLVNFLPALALLFVMMLVYRSPLGWALLLLPVVIALQGLFNLGVGMFIAALNVRFRDTQALMDVLILAWFFMTPIIYPIDLVRNATLRLLLELVNPMASLVVAYRAVLYAGQLPDLRLLLFTFAEVLLVLALGYWFFQKSSPTFVEDL